MIKHLIRELLSVCHHVIVSLNGKVAKLGCAQEKLSK